MKSTLKLLAVAVLGIAAVSCSSVNKMASLADCVTVACNPNPLEAVAGNVNATLTVTYPQGYFVPKAVLKVTPVIVYEGGEAAGAPFYFQGEKVKDNYKVITKRGATTTEKVTIPYVKGVEKSYLELRAVASIGLKSVTLPSKKVAEGVNTTYMLVKKCGKVSFKADNYQAILAQTAEGQILYTINSAEVRGKEIKGQSIKNFQAALDEIKDNERKTLVGTEVVAYASPEGGVERNAKLSDKRAGTAEKAWKKVVKGHEATAPEVKSIGQDWEGFQELVAESNIQDKDLILRVLSMYSDPAVRESEIKNMSAVYNELKGEILPELRRARFIANVEYKNYTSEELLALVNENIDVLDEEALLHVATLVKDADKKIDIYKVAIKKFGSDRAQFNTGVVLLNEGKDAKAKAAFAKVVTKDAELVNANGVIALRAGDLATAEKLFKQAGTCDAKANLGVVDILNGNYTKAVTDLESAKCGCCNFNLALAYVLTGKLDKATASIKCDDPAANYIRAIVAARQGKAADAKKFIEKASKCECLAGRAKTDIEFAAIN